MSGRIGDTQVVGIQEKGTKTDGVEQGDDTRVRERPREGRRRKEEQTSSSRRDERRTSGERRRRIT